MWKYRSILEAFLFISRDNGGINRYRTEEDVLKEISVFLDSRNYKDQLQEINAWLQTLPQKDLIAICAGEQEEAAKVMRTAPPFTNCLLDEYFQEVC